MKVPWSEVCMACVVALGAWACASSAMPARPLLPHPGLPNPRQPGEYRGPTVEQVVLALGHDTSAVEVAE